MGAEALPGLLYERLAVGAVSAGESTDKVGDGLLYGDQADGLSGRVDYERLLNDLECMSSNQ